MPQRLDKLVAGDMLASGIYPGLDGEDPPLWADGENIVFLDGKVFKDGGLLGLQTLGANPSGMKSTFSNGAKLYVGAGDTAYQYTAGGGAVAIATLASAGGLFQFVPLQAACLISNGVDPVKLWDGVSASPDITAPFNRAGVIFKYNQQAFAGNTNNGGQYLEWSNVNSFSDWTVTAYNTASNMILYDLGGDIIAARPLGVGIGIYSPSDAELFYYGGGTQVFFTGRPLKGVSAIGPNSVISLGDRHFGIGLEQAFATDLTSYLPIDEPAMRRYIETYFNKDNAQQVYGWPDWRNKVARWAIPKIGGGFFGLGFRWDKGIWTRFNNAVRVGEESGAFSYSIQSIGRRLVRTDPTQTDADGAVLQGFIQSKPLDLGNRKKFKRISNLSIDATWSGDVKVDIGFSNDPKETVSWVQTFDMAKDLYPDSQNQRSEFVFLHLKVYNMNLGASWNLSGGEIYGDYTGDVN